MADRRIALAIVHAASLMLAGSALADAKKDFQELFGREAKKVASSPGTADDAAFAAKLLETAESLSEAFALRAMLYEKAFEFGVRNPAGHAKALEAIELLETAVPAKRSDPAWLGRKLKFLKLQYALRKPKARRALAGPYMDTLIAVGDAEFADRKATQAARSYRLALRIAMDLKSSRTKEVITKLKRAAPHSKCPYCQRTGAMPCPDCRILGRSTGKRVCDGCGGKGKVTCDRCGGRWGRKCSTCGGDGKVFMGSRRTGPFSRSTYGTCYTCRGTGWSSLCTKCGKRPTSLKGTVPCSKCKGKRYLGACSTCRGGKKTPCTYCDWQQAKTLAAANQKKRRIEALQAAMIKSPKDVEKRHELILYYVVELDQPADAVKHLIQDVDEVIRTYVPLAAKAVEDVPEAACLELGNWYYQTLLPKAPPAAKRTVLGRAKRYYERFLARSTAEDVNVLKARIFLMRIEKDLKALAPTGSTSK